MSWTIRSDDDGTTREIIHWPDDADLGDIALVRGGNPILFPFCGRCFDRGEIFHWLAPDGVRRSMPIHGFARQGKFRVIRSNSDGFSAVFQPHVEARLNYPFEYEFVVTYRFKPRSIVCEFELTNFGEVPLPWSAGHHFYFKLPWSSGAQRSDYLVRIPATKRFRQDMHTGPLTVGPLLTDEEQVSNDDLIDTFHSALRNNEVVLSEIGRAGGVVVRIGTGAVPPPDAAFVTWTHTQSSPFYCIEPWMGPANAPENKIGLRFVAPGARERFVVSVEVT